MPIIAMAIDSVFRPQMVYGFAARRPQPAHGLAGLRWTKRSCRCSPTSPAFGRYGHWNGFGSRYGRVALTHVLR